MKQKILFVCHGNICRSPMAEFIMKKMVEDAGHQDEYEIGSAATSTEEVGNDLYPPAQRCLRNHGIPFTHRRARQMTQADYDHYDRIFLMDDNNYAWLARRMPDLFHRTPAGWADREDKTALLMTLVGERRDVADPWYTGDFECTYGDILRALSSLLRA